MKKWGWGMEKWKIVITILLIVYILLVFAIYFYKKAKSTKSSKVGIKIIIPLAAYIMLTLVFPEVLPTLIDVATSKYDNADSGSSKITSNGDNNNIQQFNNDGNVTINDNNKEKEATIKLEELDFKYMINDYNYTDRHTYIIGKDKVDKNKIYKLDDIYAAIVYITNNNDSKDIQLTNFKFNAKNIVVDYSPHLQIHDSGGLDENISIGISNAGWGDATDINIAVKSADPLLQDLFDEENLNSYCDRVNAGTRKDVTILFPSKMKYNIFESLKENEDITIPISIELSYNEMKEPFVYEDLLVIRKSDMYIAFGGQGALSDKVYAIPIDTESDVYTLSSQISENIEAGNTLEVPLYFFPNKSCSFDFDVEFTVGNLEEEYTIKSESRELNFEISSLYKFSESTDIQTLQAYYVDGDPNFISYPYKLN